MILRHDYLEATHASEFVFWTWGVANHNKGADTNTICEYSLLADLDDYKSASGDWEFVMYWRQLAGGSRHNLRYVHWKQSHDPRASWTDCSNKVVTGYSGIKDSDYRDFKGLAAAAAQRPELP
ncbi:hypothetical protein NFJ02_25g57910 [Pycnococcus provasolii]